MTLPEKKKDPLDGLKIVKSISRVIWTWLVYTGLSGIQEVRDVFEEMNQCTYLKYAKMTLSFSSDVVLKDMVHLMSILDLTGRLRVVLDMCGTHKDSGVLSFKPHEWRSVTNKSNDGLDNFMYLTLFVVKDGATQLSDGYTCVGICDTQVFYDRNVEDGQVRWFRDSKVPRDIPLTLEEMECNSIFVLHSTPCDCDKDCHIWHRQHAKKFEK